MVNDASKVGRRSHTTIEQYAGISRNEIDNLFRLDRKHVVAFCTISVANILEYDMVVFFQQARSSARRHQEKRSFFLLLFVSVT
jgi:hypothetical protein